MAGFSNAAGNMGFLKQKFLKNVNAGEKMMGAEFKMTLDEYPEMEYLIRSTQMPAMGRAEVEDFGQNGLKINQQGTVENSGEVAVTFAETISGEGLRIIREIIREKKYVNVNIESTPESTAGVGADSHKFKLEFCKFRTDAIDLSTEDTAAVVKPSLTIGYNWFDM